MVEDGRFVFAGGAEQARLAAGPDAQVVDLEGAFVCAGFNDSHMHLLNYGYALQVADLSSHTGSLAEVLDTMRAFLKEKNFAPGQWVRGRGWNHDYFTDEQRFPTRQDLDQVSREHPVCIVRTCGHTCVVNTKALEMIGVTAATPQPEGGCFELGPDGRAQRRIPGKRHGAGVFQAAQAQRGGSENHAAGCAEASERLRRDLLQTDDFDAFATVDWREVMEAYAQLEAEGKMTVRMYQQAQLTSVKALEEFFAEGYNTAGATNGSRWAR